MQEQSSQLATAREPINLMFVIDEQMVLQALKLLHTIIAHNRHEPISLYIVCDHVSWRWRQILKQAVRHQPQISLHLLTPHMALPGNLATSYRIPHTAYYRIFVDQLLAELPVARILYLDVDMVNVDALRPLYETDLQQQVIGAVADGGDLGRFAQMELAHVPNTRYFNSGMLLIDVDKWRDAQIATQVLTYANDFADRCKYHDQDALNAILHSDWHELHPRYNAQTNIMLGDTARYDAQTLQEVRQQPVLVHFCGRKKPWRADFPHPQLQALYYQ